MRHRCGGAVEKIKTKHPQHSIILKMDVEGSEYDILQSLVERNTLRYVDAIVMEYHTIFGRSVQNDIIDVLMKNHYGIYDGTDHNEFNVFGTGYLIAFRR